MREIAALRERLSRLSEASLHITEDLDLDAVLRSSCPSREAGPPSGCNSPRRTRREQGSAQAGAAEGEADQQQPETLRLF